MAQISNRRIVKNTGFLYLRMLVLLFISLYTSRIVLEKLGVTDYGIYNVVGGVASLCAFFSSSLTNATERFLNVALGKKDYSLANKIFNQNILIFTLLAVLVVIMAETVIKWWVFDNLDIPAGRLHAAFLVYQYTIVTVAVNLLGIVFMACIIANENMKIFSIIGIVDGILKLTIAFLINAFPVDNLVSYACMLCIETCIIQLSYAVFCHFRFPECKLKFFFDKTLIKEMFSFIGWNAAGTGIYITKDTCVNILMNIFYGPVVNTSRAVALQVSAAVASFTNNVFVAIRPQMVKAYAAKEMAELRTLFFRASKFSLLLFWLIALPVMLCVNQVLAIWLKVVPEYCAVFTVWVLADSMLAILTNPTWSIALASGKIKKYTLLGNGMLLIVLPLCYVAFHFGAPPVSAFVVIFLARMLQVISVARIIGPQLQYDFGVYVRTIISPVLLVIGSSLIVTYPVKVWIDHFNIMPFLVVLILGVVCVIVNTPLICLIGMNPSERTLVFTKLSSRFPILKNYV